MRKQKIFYNKHALRGYIVCQGTYELTDPMNEHLAEQWKLQWEKIFSNLQVKECRY